MVTQNRDDPGSNPGTDTRIGVFFEFAGLPPSLKPAFCVGDGHGFFVSKRMYLCNCQKRDVQQRVPEEAQMNGLGYVPSVNYPGAGGACDAFARAATLPIVTRYAFRSDGLRSV